MNFPNILQQEGHNILRNLSSAEYKKVINYCYRVFNFTFFKVEKMVIERQSVWSYEIAAFEGGFF